LDSHPTTLEFYVHEWQAVHQNGHIITIRPLAVLGRILIDNLQTVIVNVVLFYKVHIFYRTIITSQILYMIFLDSRCLFFDALIWIGDFTYKKLFPFRIGKLKAI
jgi:hypothetical protein